MTNNINSITGLITKQLTDQKAKTGDSNVDFSKFLNDAINNVVDDVKTAETLSNKLATGEVKDMHQVMIAMEKANLGIQLTVQVRNKVVEAYQEVMRMQV